MKKLNPPLINKNCRFTIIISTSSHAATYKNNNTVTQIPIFWLSEKDKKVFFCIKDFSVILKIYDMEKTQKIQKTIIWWRYDWDSWLSNNLFIWQKLWGNIESNAYLGFLLLTSWSIFNKMLKNYVMYWTAVIYYSIPKGIFVY